MKKIYSFVLMAAALLIGTNANASFTYTLGGVSQDVASKTLYGVFTEVLGTQDAVAVITLTSAETLSGTPARLKFNDGQDITLDLNGYALEDGLRIDVINAKLRVINSGAEAAINANNCNETGSQAFNTYGVSETDPEVARDACYFLLGENVVLNVKSYGVAVMHYGSFAGTSVSGRPTYGSTTEIKGKINATDGTGIATNGTMSFATGDKSKCPIVNIYPTAVISGSDALETIVGKAAGNSEEKAVFAKVGEGGEYKTTAAAVYGPGYAEWNIQGTLYGGVGLYLKSGKYNIDNAKIYATAAEYWEPIAYNNGFIGAGCAIIFDNNKNYGGDVTATITGAQTIVSTSASGGYSILDTETTDDDDVDETAVSNLSIADGVFTGDFKTTAELKENIEINGAITGGTYAGENIAEILSHMEGVKATETEPGIYVVKVSVKVTPNAAGLATFSARKAVCIPANSGLVAYKAIGLDGDKLSLSAVAEQGGVIPADKGVLLYKEDAAGAQFTLEEVSENSEANYEGNLLRPATAFDAAVEAGALVYILHGNELWLYTGETFPANKAFFLLPGVSGAPARIRLAFEEVQGVENVEAAFKAEKFVENGQVLIKRGENIYNVQGQIVK